MHNKLQIVVLFLPSLHFLILFSPLWLQLMQKSTDFGFQFHLLFTYSQNAINDTCAAQTESRLPAYEEQY